MDQGILNSVTNLIVLHYLIVQALLNRFINVSSYVLKYFELWKAVFVNVARMRQS